MNLTRGRESVKESVAIVSRIRETADLRGRIAAAVTLVERRRRAAMQRLSAVPGDEDQVPDGELLLPRKKAQGGIFR